MNYLYFDVECCDGTNICSFGYIITDENFNILKKEDIIINPEKGFRLGKDKFNQRINLAYSEDVFKKSPNFEYYYQTIKDLLKSDNMVLLGHSISSDIKYLKIACERYGLEKIDLSVYDTQKFYYIYNGKYPIRGLSKIVADLSIDTGSLSEHKSCDDAQMSMLVTKEICKRLNVTLQELLIMCEDATENGQEKELTKKQYLKRVKRIAENYPDRWDKETISFSDEIKETDYKQQIKLVRKIFKSGYNYSGKKSECDYILVENKKIKNNCENIKEITIEELTKMFNNKLNNVEKDKKQYNLMNQAFLESLQKKGITYEEYVKNLK